MVPSTSTDVTRALHEYFRGKFVYVLFFIISFQSEEKPLTLSGCVLVIFQERVQVCHQGFQTRENWWKQEADRVLLVFQCLETRMKHEEIASQSHLRNKRNGKIPKWFLFANMKEFVISVGVWFFLLRTWVIERNKKENSSPQNTIICSIKLQIYQLPLNFNNILSSIVTLAKTFPVCQKNRFCSRKLGSKG